MTKRGKLRKDLTADRRFHDQDKRQQAKQTYIYKDAGLMERHGFIPRWLLAVALVLVIWGGYYLVAYWQSPSAG